MCMFFILGSLMLLQIGSHINKIMDVFIHSKILEFKFLFWFLLPVFFRRLDLLNNELFDRIVTNTTSNTAEG